MVVGRWMGPDRINTPLENRPCSRGRDHVVLRKSMVVGDILVGCVVDPVGTSQAIVAKTFSSLCLHLGGT